MATYYISSSGSNVNDGLTTGTPWASVSNYVRGNTYLFKRGDTFYISIPFIPTSGTAFVTLGAYGTGAKPILSNYRNVTGGWQLDAGNIWKLDLNSANFTGHTDPNKDVGFMKVNGTIKGYKKLSKAALANPWEFYCTDPYLYVYSPVNPSTATISLTVRTKVIQLSSYMLIENLSLMGAGGHGMQADGVGTTTITIRNNDIAEIGGCYLIGYNDNTTRYGNGIEFWDGGRDILVEGNTVSQCFDVAYTLQGSHAQATWTNVIAQNNTFSNNEQSLEVWTLNNGVGFINCQFINNNCYRAGYNWGHGPRDEKLGAHILMYRSTAQNNQVLVEGNLFEDAIDSLYFMVSPVPAGQIFRNNTIRLASGTLLKNHLSKQTIENPTSFVTETGLETGSTWEIINQPKTRRVVRCS